VGAVYKEIVHRYGETLSGGVSIPSSTGSPPIFVDPNLVIADPDSSASSIHGVLNQSQLFNNTNVLDILSMTEDAGRDGDEEWKERVNSMNAHIQHFRDWILANSKLRY
jgi:hypothetical protein